MMWRFITVSFAFAGRVGTHGGAFVAPRFSAAVAATWHRKAARSLQRSKSKCEHMQYSLFDVMKREPLYPWCSHYCLLLCPPPKKKKKSHLKAKSAHLFSFSTNIPAASETLSTKEVVLHQTSGLVPWAMHFPVVPCALFPQWGSWQRAPPPWPLQ